MNLSETDIFVRFVNNKINYMTDDINDEKLTTLTIKNLNKCDNSYLIRTKKYHMEEVYLSDLPVEVDYKTIRKYFVVNNIIVDHLRFFVTEDKQFSIMVVTQKQKKTFLLITYNGQVYDSPFTRSIKLVKHTHIGK